MADEEEVVWPWGMTERDPDPASRPWVFRPQGFLAAVLEDIDRAEEAKAGLQQAGFAEKHLRTYPGSQVLEDRERFLAQQGPLRRVVGEVTIDSKAVALFANYAREGRAFLWVYAPDREDANRAIRALSGFGVLHIRYHGHDTLEDIHVR
ncbi:MAG TPA: hypothetical protein VHH09_03630 [Acidimicrobiales bacterium]|nr:hypothetical protein [Acidimicrobiales bacterium]